MKKLLLLAVLAAFLVLPGCSKKKEEETKAPETAAPAETAAAPEGKEIRAAFVYVGPVGDGGWTFAHDMGRQVMAKLPYVKDVTFIESVPEGAESTRIITSLAQKGYNLIFTTSFGYMDPTIEVAAKFPDVVFMHCSGYKTAANVGTYFGRIEQARYLSGIVAGKMTKSNVLGYVAAFPIPEVIRGINAFTMGARSVNPKAVVKVVWTQTWFDPAKERDAAESLLDVKADVITMHQDTPAPLQAAEKRGAFAIGYNTDMASQIPGAWLTAPVWNWGPLYTQIAEAVHNGTWKSEQIWYGIEHNLVDLAPMSKLVPAEVQALVNEKKAEMQAGKFVLFAGPIKDNAGKVVVEAGKSMTDPEQLSMNFLVEGVQGTIPK
ncbi:BMP family ABC transporter substrate-binding protein [Seleniivibrio woodruffii]|uniref:Nucleoside-binding protein n=1 Tax=Seleniivibrio woodruffii TaxID=1078050 RepID=A0A4R1K763_9BACT|nr:BMP family ABC transporter substrate-binding protein [Seleniivibrio woodruffii]TCK59860.1 nucleoside-binding protein [Seleniivibrio woodruffii]TVZ35919.1 nucleoside-binding protein [Seleniivibrio woodruffii]